jgi:Ca-activated chloride channel family protein
MSFGWPGMLAGLLVVPALVFAYVRWQRHAAVSRARLAELGVRAVGPATRLGWRRHLPAGVLVAGVTVLVFALARPEVSLALPKRTGTVLIAIDVSNSMSADDVSPTRLDAARAGALDLVGALPEAVEVGVVAFGDGALVVAQPTSDREPVTDALARLTPSGGTSTGAGLYTALEAIAGEPLAIVDETGNDTPEDDTTVERGREDELEFDPANVDVGYFGAAEVVMFSDGENTSGIDPLEVSDLLAAAGVKVTTIAVGTEAGAVIEVEGYSVSTALDSEQLEQIAAATNGTFYAAADADAFGAIADALELEWRREGEQTEITGILAAIAAGLLILGAGLAAWLLGRVI